MCARSYVHVPTVQFIYIPSYCIDTDVQQYNYNLQTKECVLLYPPQQFPV